MRAAASGVGGAVGNVTISNDSSGITGGAAASSQENWIAGGFALGALLCFYAYFSNLFESKSFRSLSLRLVRWVPSLHETYCVGCEW
jgi:hypothetical protein